MSNDFNVGDWVKVQDSASMSPREYRNRVGRIFDVFSYQMGEYHVRFSDGFEWCYNRRHLELTTEPVPEPRRVRKVTVFFAWYDLWMGAYYDRNNRTWYVCPLPCCVIKIASSKEPADGE